MQVKYPLHHQKTISSYTYAPTWQSADQTIPHWFSIRLLQRTSMYFWKLGVDNPCLHSNDDTTKKVFRNNKNLYSGDDTYHENTVQQELQLDQKSNITI